MSTSLLALALAVLPLASENEPDLVRLKSGKAIECRVLYADDAQVVYRAKKKTEEVARGEVAELLTVEQSLREFLQRFDAADLRSAPALSELAQWAEANALPGEAHCMWIRVLLVDSQNELAWTRLGGVRQRGTWKYKVRGRFYDLAELKQRAGDWKTALELPTAHFLLRTDGDPSRMLDAAIDLERGWLAFYDLFGKPLKLYVFEETPEVELYTDWKQAPNPPAPGMTAWYAPGASQLQVIFGSSSGAIAAEFCELMIHQSFRRTLDNKSGQMEGWIRAGIAQIFGFGFHPSPGHASFEFKTPNKALFSQVANAPEPMPLSRLLGSGRGAFDGAQGELNAATAYTLVHYLAFDGDGKHLPKFADYMRAAYVGKSGPSRFYEALGTDEKTLEKEWSAYVKRIAGG